ncbi:SMP-30/gluconolactonase/LRE family protein [Microlunatus parietis]|uniref:Sugar lactone lactonase YvrE n=1 Tax=Microlunatus parietis TaxID=682979 RepID=A0A7Y9LER4_9ACTN|nr:SMP-30/gluconolactonase/LRE family protein [Microlunatus parietis]NYE73291.1 sugar lactone lactonase YvrE [Microlunatus parietis]
MHAEQLTDPIVDHGEGPVFSDRWAGPRWVDLLAGDILELDPDSGPRRHHVGTVAAMIRPRLGGGHVIAGERGLLLADDDALDAPVRVLPEVWDSTEVRMNEGGCDPAGNLYLGSMAYDGRDGGGNLYRFGPDLAPTVAVPAVTISNGLDWSPDETLAYYVDTRTGRIDVFDWDAEGGLRNRRPFVEIDGEGGPDGLTVDAEGGVWVALYGGWAVRRYTPQGRLDAVIEVPARQVTAVTFAGPDLDQLIITTSRHGLSDDDAGPAGSLFGVRPGIRGRPVREFAG